MFLPGVFLLTVALLMGGSAPASALQQDGGGDGGTQNAGAAPQVGLFQPTRCPFSVGAGLVEGQQVTCGFVAVPQNHTVNDGKTLHLAVAIFKAPAYLASVDPAPVLYLQGGPGGSGLQVAASITAANYRQFIFHHNLIFFDQRGTGYSQPALACPELSGLDVAGLASDGLRLPLSSSQRATEQALHRCYHRLTAQGINLNTVNTLQNAADVADLIHALGYQKMTLYGGSYGTRLALTVMHYHPDVVRAAVLDSVEAPDSTELNEPRDAQRAFKMLFQGCARDATCQARYPDLGHVFFHLVDALNASPVRLTYTNPTTRKQESTILSGDALVDWIFEALYSTTTIPHLPRTIYQVKAHRYDLLTRIISALTGTVTGYSYGMRYSTECSESWPSLTQQDVANAIKGIAPQIARAMGQRVQLAFDVCQFWKVRPVAAQVRQWVISDLPTLVLAGAYDPVTPPAGSQETAAHLSRSFFFLFPGTGHGVGLVSSCGRQIVSAFEDQPERRPDSSCLAHVGEPAFQ